MKVDKKNKNTIKQDYEVKLIFRVGIPFFVVFFLCHLWHIHVTNDLNKKLLESLYTYDEIIQKELRVIHTYYKTSISDGTLLSDQVHQKYRNEQRKRTIFSTLLPFFALFIMLFYIGLHVKGATPRYSNEKKNREQRHNKLKAKIKNSDFDKAQNSLEQVRLSGTVLSPSSSPVR
jgi:hypothetical protein